MSRGAAQHGAQGGQFNMPVSITLDGIGQPNKPESDLNNLKPGREIRYSVENPEPDTLVRRYSEGKKKEKAFSPLAWMGENIKGGLSGVTELFSKGSLLSLAGIGGIFWATSGTLAAGVVSTALPLLAVGAFFTGTAAMITNGLDTSRLIALGKNREAEKRGHGFGSGAFTAWMGWLGARTIFKHGLLRTSKTETVKNAETGKEELKTVFPSSKDDTGIISFFKWGKDLLSNKSKLAVWEKVEGKPAVLKEGDSLYSSLGKFSEDRMGTASSKAGNIAKDTASAVNEKAKDILFGEDRPSPYDLPQYEKPKLPEELTTWETLKVATKVVTAPIWAPIKYGPLKLIKWAKEKDIALYDYYQQAVREGKTDSFLIKHPKLRKIGELLPSPTHVAEIAADVSIKAVQATTNVGKAIPESLNKPLTGLQGVRARLEYKKNPLLLPKEHPLKRSIKDMDNQIKLEILRENPSAWNDDVELKKLVAEFKKSLMNDPDPEYRIFMQEFNARKGIEDKAIEFMKTNDKYKNEFQKLARKKGGEDKAIDFIKDKNHPAYSRKVEELIAEEIRKEYYENPEDVRLTLHPGDEIYEKGIQDWVINNWNNGKIPAYGFTALGSRRIPGHLLNVFNNPEDD